MSENQKEKPIFRGSILAQIMKKLMHRGRGISSNQKPQGL